MNHLKVIVDQRGADQHRQPLGLQFAVPVQERLQEPAHVGAVLRRLVPAAVRLITHEGGHVSWVVSQQSGLVVLVGQVPGDGPVHGPDEVCAQAPFRVRRCPPGQVVGRLDVDCPTLLRALDLCRGQGESELGLSFREGAALDAVGAEDA